MRRIEGTAVVCAPFTAPSKPPSPLLFQRPVVCLHKQCSEGGGRRRVRERVARLLTERTRKRVALTRHLTLSLTGEARAVVEVQVLHAFGDDECTDITGEARAAVEVQALHACGKDECTDIT